MVWAKPRIYNLLTAKIAKKRIEELRIKICISTRVAYLGEIKIQRVIKRIDGNKVCDIRLDGFIAPIIYCVLIINMMILL